MPKKPPPIYDRAFCQKVERDWVFLFGFMAGAGMSAALAILTKLAEN